MTLSSCPSGLDCLTTEAQLRGVLRSVTEAKSSGWSRGSVKGDDAGLTDAD